MESILNSALSYIVVPMYIPRCAPMITTGALVVVPSMRAMTEGIVKEFVNVLTVIAPPVPGAAAAIFMPVRTSQSNQMHAYRLEFSSQIIRSGCTSTRAVIAIVVSRECGEIGFEVGLRECSEDRFHLCLVGRSRRD